MTSRYAETYESWRRDPQGFWAGVPPPRSTG